ncbi:putative MFS family arabinose efflux permease [Azonexus fungiphilus]|uniref:Putative MFS family arabinose efflux permease n=1 Tax=Azonexus fungiphilus TaxID=146940 RepID=A0A495WIL5_9RHOO|nr:MFS transporter [Azonexus fungiphilus]RKT60483.1 putative MFS family arabinose efflux permease [Azonexus fungiphilus]
MPAGIRALAHPNFRRYFAGQAISILGSWIQQVALSWLVYRLTGSAALLGVTAFCGLIPQLLVGPLAGAWIDKHDKRRWLLVVQGLMAVQAFVLAWLTWAAWINPAFIIAMALLLGTLSAFDTPLRQSLIGSFVGSRDDLPNALALNAMLFNAGRFVGPPVAGVLLGLTSEAACFALNGISFLALIVGLLRIRGVPPPRARGSVGEVFREGLRYAWQTWHVRMLILTLIVLNLTASTYAVLLPVFARDVFAGDATTLGWLWGAAGCGAFLSTLFLATRKAGAALVSAVAAGVLISAVSMLLFALGAWLPLALAAMVGLGFGISVCNVGINMILQSSAPDALRGRIVSFFTSARFGFDALGGLLAGFVASSFGAAATLLAEGAVLLLFVLVLFARRQRLREQLSAVREEQ